jgi:hypothetical protein
MIDETLRWAVTSPDSLAANGGSIHAEQSENAKTNWKDKKEMEALHCV